MCSHLFVLMVSHVKDSLAGRYLSFGQLVVLLEPWSTLCLRRKLTSPVPHESHTWYALSSSQPRKGVTSTCSAERDLKTLNPFSRRCGRPPLRPLHEKHRAPTLIHKSFRICTSHCTSSHMHDVPMVGILKTVPTSLAAGLWLLSRDGSGKPTSAHQRCKLLVETNSHVPTQQHHIVKVCC